jgi:hypothetical protein
MTQPVPLTPNRRRHDLAKQIAFNCPKEFCAELALTGSTARGLADEDSDLEINLWFAVLPSLEARMAWLEQVGALDIAVQEGTRSDESYWISCRFGDIDVEVGWQTFEALESLVNRLVSGEITDRKLLSLADLILSAIPLATNGWLPAQQQKLTGYSDAVQAWIVSEAVGLWRSGDRMADARKLAARGEKLALVEHLLLDATMTLRLLYAVNRRWEPGRKWMLSVAQDLPTQPADFLVRLEALFGLPNRVMVETAARLASEVLALVPASYDIGETVAALENASQARPSSKEGSV